MSQWDAGMEAFREEKLIRAGQGIAYVPFFPLGGFTPLQSSTLSLVAQRIGVTPLQVALGWLLHRSPNILLIPGTSSLSHLRENLAAGDLALLPELLTELDGIVAGRRSRNGVAGASGHVFGFPFAGCPGRAGLAVTAATRSFYRGDWPRASRRPRRARR